ncbi:hypothetical protein D1007_43280 [Hordeum vulgare]|nr:hypothetical protein D1007_43280 [Hordeum vulgare]
MLIFRCPSDSLNYQALHSKSGKLGKHAYQLDRPHLPLQPEFEDNEVVMDDNDPNSAAAGMAADAAEAEAARNRPLPVPKLRTEAEKMAFLVSTFEGMEKNIQEMMQKQKSHERVVETKFHNMDVKATLGGLKNLEHLNLSQP